MAVTLGLDLGTSSCKGVLYCSSGAILARHAAVYPTHRPQCGWVEQDPADWIEAVRLVCRRLAEHRRWSEVEAVGLSGQMHTFILLDGHGEPLGRAVSWQDTRSASLLPEIDPGVWQRVLQITYNNPGTIMSLLPLIWLRHEQPSLLASARQLLLSKDYLRHELSGAIATDPTDAAGTLLWDARTKTWSQEVLDAFDLPGSILPVVLEPTLVSGQVHKAGKQISNLPLGLPVVVGSSDLAAEMVCCGEQVDEPRLVLRYGSAGAILSTAEAPLRGSWHCYPAAKRGIWFLVAGTHSCGAAVAWARQCLFPSSSFEDLFNMARSVEPGSRGLLFIPHLAGERAPYFDPYLRGHFVGLTLEHGPAHMARAVLEGVAFSLYDAAAVLPEAQAAVSLQLVGGHGERRFWGQLLSDLFGRPLEVLTQASAAAGAAMLAATALGLEAARPGETIACMARSELTERYRRRFLAYRAAVQALAAISTEMYGTTG